MKILATHNIKGGAGKTATAVNISHLAARDGMRVLLRDLDPHGAAGFLLVHASLACVPEMSPNRHQQPTIATSSNLRT